MTFKGCLNCTHEIRNAIGHIRLVQRLQEKHSDEYEELEKAMVRIERALVYCDHCISKIKDLRISNHLLRYW